MSFFIDTGGLEDDNVKILTFSSAVKLTESDEEVCNEGICAYF